VLNYSVKTPITYLFGPVWLVSSVYGTEGGNSDNTTHAVGEKEPNVWGLFDMHGNVFEWCQDRYGAYGSEKVITDPTGAASGEYRVLRGGAFTYRPGLVRSADRTITQPAGRTRGGGFRLARTYDLSP